MQRTREYQEREFWWRRMGGEERAIVHQGVLEQWQLYLRDLIEPGVLGIVGDLERYLEKLIILGPSTLLLGKFEKSMPRCEKLR
jgi:hypothetical protein